MDCVVIDLLDEAREAGLRLSANGDQLKIRGPKSRAPLVAQLTARKPDVLAMLSDEREQRIHLRMDVFRPQVPVTGPIPLLVMTPTITPGACLSCGECMSSPDRLRCELCAEAARRVVEEAEHALRQSRDDQ